MHDLKTERHGRRFNERRHHHIDCPNENSVRFVVPSFLPIDEMRTRIHNILQNVIKRNGA